jgi:hypothetical protein
MQKLEHFEIQFQLKSGKNIKGTVAHRPPFAGPQRARLAAELRKQGRQGSHGWAAVEPAIQLAGGETSWGIACGDRETDRRGPCASEKSIL